MKHRSVVILTAGSSARAMNHLEGQEKIKVIHHLPEERNVIINGERCKVLLGHGTTMIYQDKKDFEDAVRELYLSVNSCRG